MLWSATLSLFRASHQIRCVYRFADDSSQGCQIIPGHVQLATEQFWSSGSAGPCGFPKALKTLRQRDCTVISSVQSKEISHDPHHAGSHIEQPAHTVQLLRRRDVPPEALELSNFLHFENLF